MFVDTRSELMRRGLAVAVALAVTFAMATGPAAADPANNSSASAYGLSATGLIPISPTITAEASQPPDEDVVETPQLLEVPLGGLALAGVVGVDAHAHQADDIVPVTAAVPATPGTSDPVILTGVNAQGLAKTAGASLVFSDPGGLDPVRVLLAQISSALGGLLGADAVVAEAVATCVNNQPVFETGYQVAGLGGLVGDVLDPVVQQLLSTLLGLLGPDAVLSSVISIEAGRVTPLADGVAIDGLVVSVPLLNQEIIISHAEAHMQANCAVAPPEPPQPTGPGAIAPRGDVAAPAASLAVTGSEVPYLPIGAGMVAAAFLIRYVVRRRPERAEVG
jgi:hypothetical protein